MKKTIAAFVATFLVLAFLFAGSWTSNNYFYKPSQGESGASYVTNFNTGVDRADAALALLMQVQGFKNIKVRNNSASKIDVTADAVACYNVGGDSQIIKNFSATINCGTTGANGLDTGSPSTNWYYFYIIAKSDGTSAGLASLSSTSPTMPSGYTYKKLISAIKYITSDFDNVDQIDTVIVRNAVYPASDFAADSSSWQSVALDLPTNISAVILQPWTSSNTYDIAFSICWTSYLLAPTANNLDLVAKTTAVKMGASNVYASMSPFRYAANPADPLVLKIKGYDSNHRGDVYIYGYELNL